MNRFFTIFLLTLILGIVFLLGGKMILSGDFFFLADQARDYLLTQDIVDNRNITLIGTHSGLGGFFHGPLWLYMLIPFYVFGGGDPFIFTYAYLLIAIATVICGYFVGKSLYGEKTGLTLAFLLAVSPSIWAYVPNTIGVNMVPLVFLLMFYFLIRYIRGDARSYIFAIFFAGLSLQFETALPLILLPVVIGSFFLNKKALHKPKIIFLSIASFVLSLATFILFDLRHSFLMTRSLLTIFTGGKHEQGYLAFPERIGRHLESLGGVYTSILIQETVILQLILVLLITLFTVIVFQKKVYKQKEWKEFLYLLLFPVIIFVFYLFYAYPVFPEYVLGLSIPVCLAMLFILKIVWNHKIGKVIAGLFIVVTLFEAIILISKPYQHDLTSGSYRNQKAVAEWILQDSKGKLFGYYVYTPATFTYGMDYLLWWQSKQSGITKPESKKLQTTYLILYPTLTNDPGAHAFWKKHKLRTNATVIGKKEFMGGIIVEKLTVKPGEQDADPSYHQNLIFR